MMLKRKPLKRTPFKRKRKEVDVQEIEKQYNFFLSIWRKRSPYCAICGRYLGREPLSYMFDHILEKSKYPALKYEESNIVLVCLDCHDKKSRGFTNDKYEELIKKVKNLFGI